MGSSTSKDAANGVRSKGTSVFRSSCLGRSSASASSSSSDNNEDKVSSPQNKENGRLKGQTCIDENGTKSCHPKGECVGKVKTPQPNRVPSISSNIGSDEWDQESITPIDSGAGSSSTQTVVARSSSPLSRSRSRFSFIPSSISFRLSRAGSLGSSRPCSPFSTSVSISNTEEGFHVHNVSDSSDDRNEAHELSQLNLQASGLSAYLPNADALSSEDVARNTSQRNHMEIENPETRRPDRRFVSQEPMEGSVRFSRTLSVGRLRDRVLRRTSLSDRLFGQLQEDREIGDTGRGGSRPFWSGVTSASSSDGNTEIPPTSSSYHLSSTSTSTNSSNQDYGVETSQLREASNHDLLGQRTAFLERRRRIRSQVRALQRLGSRSESLSGHDRSCILSGQHRTGRCRCRTSSGPSNPDDDTGARASISRIVMLAEALFEVLDEIHQQSVVLSSRPSVSSIGSVPAPQEVVECMPVKIYTKSHKHQNDEAAQCYICLVEYEERDCMRILPCHHEFHQTCIDKWLKEIHRVCPLCRGDVCRSDVLLTEKAD